MEIKIKIGEIIMSKDLILYILIGILALHVLFKNIVTLEVITYVFIIYMLYIFIMSLRNKPKE